MPIVSDSYAFVVGVDTHAATHSFEIIEANTAKRVDVQRFPTTTAGLNRAINWIGSRTQGNITDTLISIEGTGSYGTRLTRALLETGYRVVDAPSPKRDRGKPKNDAIDARKAALAMLPMETNTLADARAGDLHECLSTLLAARNRMTNEKTRAFNALTALLRTHDLGIDARRKPNLTTGRQITRWRQRNEPLPTQLARAETIRLATQITELITSLKTNQKQLHDLVRAHQIVLLEQPGIGAINAAIILNAWAYHGRVKSASAWAVIAGVAPIQIASGGHTHHRLNRGGDRQLNRAFHSIVVTNSRHDPTTRDYIARRTSQGKAPRTIRRALKTHIAKKIYRLLNNHPAPTT